jgi:hypothetical protein
VTSSEGVYISSHPTQTSASFFFIQAFFKIYRVHVSFMSRFFLFSPLAVHLLLGSNTTYARFSKIKLSCVQYTKFFYLFKIACFLMAGLLKAQLACYVRANPDLAFHKNLALQSGFTK